MSQRYLTDLTDTEWTILTPFIPAAKPGGRPRTTDMRNVVNAIFYVLRGMPMAPSPHRFSAPPDRLPLFPDLAMCRRVGADARHLRGDLREASGRTRTPSAEIIDSQTVKTTEKGGSGAMMGASASAVASATS